LSKAICKFCPLSEFNFELLFHVVDNKCLKYDMIIGQDIFQLGFGVMLDCNRFAIYRTQTVLSVIDDNILNKIDLIDSDKSKLNAILAKYFMFFIDGISSRRVTTGSLEIVLLYVNKTVQRRDRKG